MKELEPIEKLRKLLCTCEDVEKDLMELRFGTEITTYQGDYTHFVTMCHSGGVVIYPPLDGTDDMFISSREQLERLGGKIIGNNIEERHIRRHCQEKGIPIFFDQNGNIGSVEPDYGEDILITKLDNTKPLHLQSNQVIEDIVKYLTAKK